ncbi:hypothetical protein PALB_36100 [Pseudoalteromonas luteoviolacea B = ATCC 29581]|nr:hypothetical protein PALB_36100 [Pseudoalteromonas luteoviolacea B = ATCC 29581]
MPRNSIQTEQVSSPILVVLPKFIGDAINTLPALELLANLYPNQAIHVLVRPYLTMLLKKQSIPNIELIPDLRYADPKKGLWHFAKELKKTYYQLAFLFRGSFTDALLCRLAGVSHLVGYAQNGRSPLLSHAIKLNLNHHYIQRYCRLINDVHGKPFKEYRLPKLQSQFSHCKPTGFTHVIGCYFGSPNKAPRYYPSHLAKETIFMLLTRPNTAVVLLGDASEKANNDFLCKSAGVTNLFNLAGKCNLSEYVDLIASLDALISIDSGPMHIACAVDTPCIALVGLGTSPWSVVAPKNQAFIALEAKSRHLDDNKIIEAIAPNQISESLHTLLTHYPKD